MKRILLVGCVLSLVSGAVFAAAPQTEQDQLSYTLGYDMGENFKSQSVDVNPNVFEQGFVDGLKGNSPQMSQDQMQQAMLNFQKHLLVKRADQYKGISQTNAKEGADFLAKNKTAPGVVTLPNGLQYKVVIQGNGPKPTADSVVTVDYAGTFINGKEFDSSYKRKQPATFPLSEVIQGWQQALVKMPVGSTWEIYVPSNLAYGDRMVGPIGPNETLIFKIHLIKVSKDDSGSSASNDATANAATPAASQQ